MKKIKQKLHLTKKSELVTPLSKITPPPPPTYLSKNSYLKHLSLLKQFTLILFTVISIAACNATENNEAKTSSQAEIIVNKLARSTNTVSSLKPDNYWANIFPFSIKVSDVSLAGEYRLAVRLASADKPDATKIRSSVATIVRNLSTNSINVLMSFHMDTDLFDAATDWGQTWGDGSVLLDKAKTARLQPETAYKLYAVRLTNDHTVHSLSSFTTDAELTPANLDTLGITEQSFFNFPLDFTDSPGASGDAFTIRQNEPFLFLVGSVNPSTSVSVIINGTIISDCDNTTNDCFPTVSHHDIFSQSLVAAGDKRVVPLIMGGRGFIDSLLSNEKLTYTASHSSTSYSFNMIIETE